MEYTYHSWSELQGYVLNIVPLQKGNRHIASRLVKQGFHYFKLYM